MGQPDTPRAKDFTQFLGEHFTQVAVMDVAKFDPSQTSAYDVVILDADPDSAKPYDMHSDLAKLAKLQTRKLLEAHRATGAFRSARGILVGLAAGIFLSVSHRCGSV